MKINWHYINTLLKGKKVVYPSWFSNGSEFEGEPDYLRSVKKNFPLITLLTITSCSGGGYYFFQNEIKDKLSGLKIPEISVYAQSNPTISEPKAKVSEKLEKKLDKPKATIVEKTQEEILAEENSKLFGKKNTETNLETSLKLSSIETKKSDSQETVKIEIKEVKPKDYDKLAAFYTENQKFVTEIKPLFQVVYQGKFDLNNDGKLEDWTIYSGGDALVKFENGTTRKLNTSEISHFFISSIMNLEEIQADFTTSDGKVLYTDSIPESHILKLTKENPKYISSIRNLGIATNIYTKQTKSIFEPKLSRLEKILKY